MRFISRSSYFFLTATLLSGCGLALNLDDYEIVDTTGSTETTSTSGDGDSSGDGDTETTSGSTAATSSGDGDVAGSGGGKTTTSSGDGDSDGGAPVDGSGGDPAIVPPDCEDTSQGDSPDKGCNKDAPVCSDGVCVECAKDSDCGNDGHDCSQEFCDAGECSRAYDHSACSGYGDPCLETTCTEIGCQVKDISEEIDLLEGSGNFDGPGSGPWVIEGDAELIRPPMGTPYSGGRVALMTSGASDEGTIYARVVVPPGTLSIRVDGYYRSYGTGTDHSGDFFRVGFWTGGRWYAMVLDTLSNKELAEVTEWTAFTGTLIKDDFSFIEGADDPSTIEFDLFGTTDAIEWPTAQVRNFAADDVTLTALVCQP